MTMIGATMTTVLVGDLPRLLVGDLVVGRVRRRGATEIGALRVVRVDTTHRRAMTTTVVEEDAPGVRVQVDLLLEIVIRHRRIVTVIATAVAPMILMIAIVGTVPRLEIGATDSRMYCEHG
jgi:hypothetical protein